MPSPNPTEESEVEVTDGEHDSEVEHESPQPEPAQIPAKPTVQTPTEDVVSVTSEEKGAGDAFYEEEPEGGYFRYEDEQEDDRLGEGDVVKSPSIKTIEADEFDEQFDEDLQYIGDHLPQEPSIEDLVLKTGKYIEDIQQLPESLVPPGMIDTFTELMENILLHRKAHELSIIRNREQTQLIVEQEKCMDTLREQLIKAENKLADKDFEKSLLEKKLDAYHLREHQLQEELDMHVSEVKHLHEEMQRRDDLQADIEEEIGTSGRAREAYARQKQKLKQQMDAVERTLADMKDERDKVVNLHKSAVLQIEDLQKEIVGKNDLLSLKEDTLKKANTDREGLRQVLRNSNRIFKLVQRSLTYFEKHIIKLEEANFAQAAQIDGLLRKTTEVFRQNMYYADEGTKCKMQINELQECFENTFRYLQGQESKLKEQLLKVRDLERTLTVLDRKYSKTLAEKNQAVSDKESMLNEYRCYDRALKQKDYELDKLKKQIVVLEAAQDRHQRIINNLREQKKKALGKVDESIIRLSSEKTEQLVQSDEISRLNRELESIRSVREKLLSDNTTLMKKIEENGEEIRMYKSELYNAKRQLSDMDQTHSQFLTKYNQLIDNKNALHAKYLDCKTMLSNQESKVKLSEWQIEHLKEEMRLKDLLFKNKDIENRRNHFAKRRLEIYYKGIHHSFTELKQVTGGKNQELVLVSEELKKTITYSLHLESKSEKDKIEIATLRTQLDRRVTEITMINERLDVLNSLLSRGEAHYNQRMQDIRLLKIEVQKLRREKNILIKGFQNNADLRSEIYFLHKDLSEERQRSKALQEQLENPLNYHRWRLLEGTDPEKKEMIDKTLILQRKLYLATKQITMNKCKYDDLLLLYDDLKEKYEAMPSYEEMAKLTEIKMLYRQKCDAYRALECQVVALEREIRDYKYEMDKHKKDLNEAKKQYYDLKLKEDRRRLNLCSRTTLPKLETTKDPTVCS